MFAVAVLPEVAPTLVVVVEDAALEPFPCKNLPVKFDALPFRLSEMSPEVKLRELRELTITTKSVQSAAIAEKVIEAAPPEPTVTVSMCCI